MYQDYQDFDSGDGSWGYDPYDPTYADTGSAPAAPPAAPPPPADTPIDMGGYTPWSENYPLPGGGTGNPGTSIPSTPDWPTGGTPHTANIGQATTVPQQAAAAPPDSGSGPTGYSANPGDYGMPDTSNGGGGSAPQTSFVNTAAHPFAGPTNIPDPSNPGYDTSGFLMGTKYDPTTGKLTVPNPNGNTATTYIDPKTGQLMLPPKTAGGAGTIPTSPVDVGGPAGNPFTSVAPTPAPPAPPPPVDPGTVSVDDTFNKQLRQFLLDQMGKLGGPVSADDPELAPAIGAFNAQTQRDQQRDREALAEQYYAMGGGAAPNQQGAYTQGVQQLLEGASANRANFSGQAVWNSAQAKRQQLSQMTSLALGAGQTDVATQLQSQIANIDAKLRAAGLNQNSSQFNDQLAFNYANLQAQLNRDAFLRAMQPGGGFNG